jgi:hypothetical protein
MSLVLSDEPACEPAGPAFVPWPRPERPRAQSAIRAPARTTRTERSAWFTIFAAVVPIKRSTAL